MLLLIMIERSPLTLKFLNNFFGREIWMDFRCCEPVVSKAIVAVLALR